MLNGTFNEATGERLVLNVLETLTLLLEGNNASKVIISLYVVLSFFLSVVLISLGLSCQAAFRVLVGVGYQTLQSLLLDYYKWLPSERLLDALLNMLVDGKFEINEKTTIKASIFEPI